MGPSNGPSNVPRGEDDSFVRERLARIQSHIEAELGTAEKRGHLYQAIDGLRASIDSFRECLHGGATAPGVAHRLSAVEDLTRRLAEAMLGTATTPGAVEDIRGLKAQTEKAATAVELGLVKATAQTARDTAIATHDKLFMGTEKDPCIVTRIDRIEQERQRADKLQWAWRVAMIGVLVKGAADVVTFVVGR